MLWPQPIGNEEAMAAEMGNLKRAAAMEAEMGDGGQSSAGGPPPAQAAGDAPPPPNAAENQPPGRCF